MQPEQDEASADRLLVMGQISGPWGVKGWLKVTPYTELQDALLDYPVWQLHSARGWTSTRVVQGRVHGKGLVVQLEGITDRDAAAALGSVEIGIRRSELPEPEPDEYYWADLIGLRVETVEGRLLGTVDHLIETGANDVLVVTGEQEYLVPYVPGQVIRSVALDEGVIRVDWDPDY